MFLAMQFGTATGEESCVYGRGEGKHPVFSRLLCLSDLVLRQVIGELRPSQLGHLYSQLQLCFTDRSCSEAQPQTLCKAMMPFILVCV